MHWAQMNFSQWAQQTHSIAMKLEGQKTETFKFHVDKVFMLLFKLHK